MKNYISLVVVFLMVISFTACFKNNSNSSLISDENIVLKNGFSIQIPAGWEETAAPVGTSMMVVNTSQEPTDERAKTINFHDYYTITLDSQENLEEGEYIEILKDQLEQGFPDIEFLNENSTEINANQAYAFEASMRQNEIDFKIFLVIINGRENDVWILTFNTTALDWDKYVDVFQEVVNSFLIQ